jgi:predicted nucleic acid-binding protein
MILLDTDIVIDVLRGYFFAIDWLRSLDDDEEILLPGLVVMELIQGCKNKAEVQALRRFVADFEVVWPSSEACDQALTIFAHFSLSHGLGLLDALIGQMSVDLGLPLHTFNQKHYAVIPGLETIQPYKK